MKAISLRQPHALLTVLGLKRIETRTWRTSYRGPLLIHASKSFTLWAMALCLQEPFRSALARADYYTPGQLPGGAIIGKVRLVGCYEIVAGRSGYISATSGVWITPPEEPELSFGDYTPGRYAWLLEQPVKFDPIPYRGQLGLFDVPDDVIEGHRGYKFHPEWAKKEKLGQEAAHE